MSKKLYKILGISENSNLQEIKKTYRKLAKKYHPDVCKETDCEDKFKEINTAYEILGDEQKKQQYDMYGDSMFENNGFSSNNRHNSGMDIDDILRSMFGGGFSGFARQEVQLDIEAELQIPIKLAKEGGKLPLNTNMGSFTLNIKKDIRENDKIKVTGKGHSHNGKTGDLYLHIKIVGDEIFKVNEIDLYIEQTIPLKTAIFGGELIIDYFNNEKITVKIPEGVSYGTKLRVEGKGFSDKRFNEPGDLYVVLDIELPKIKDLSDKAKKVLKEDLSEEIETSVIEKIKKYFN